MAVMVGVTPAPESLAALRRAAEEARLRDTELILFEYVKIDVMGDANEVLDNEASVERYLARLRAELEASDLAVRTLQATGTSSPGHELVRAAADEDVDLLVIGLRRRSPVGKLVLGSTSQDVLLHAECPVLAVKAPSDR